MIKKEPEKKATHQPAHLEAAELLLRAQTLLSQEECVNSNEIPRKIDAVLRILDTLLAKLQVELSRISAASYWQLVRDYRFSSEVFEIMNNELIDIQETYSGLIAGHSSPEADEFVKRVQTIFGLTETAIFKLSEEVLNRTDVQNLQFIYVASRELSNVPAIQSHMSEYVPDEVAIDNWYYSLICLIEDILLSRYYELLASEDPNQASAIDTFLFSLLQLDLEKIINYGTLITGEINRLAIDIALHLKSELQESENRSNSTQLTAEEFHHERITVPDSDFFAESYWEEYKALLMKDLILFFNFLKNQDNPAMLAAAQQADWESSFFTTKSDFGFETKEKVTQLQFAQPVINLLAKLLPGYRSQHPQITQFLELYFDKDTLKKLAEEKNLKI